MSRLKNQAVAANNRTARDGTTGAALLGDLAQDGIDLFCWCNQCHHNTTVAMSRLLARFGPACTVPKVGSRMRCSSCGSKDVATRPAWPSPGQIARYSE